jgi:hypothetical protein
MDEKQHEPSSDQSRYRARLLRALGLDWVFGLPQNYHPRMAKRLRLQRIAFWILFAVLAGLPTVLILYLNLSGIGHGPKLPTF